MKRRQPVQLELKARTRGGRREGAGRKGVLTSGLPHLRRPALASRHPVHVTLKVRLARRLNTAFGTQGDGFSRPLPCARAPIAHGGAQCFGLRRAQLRRAPRARRLCDSPRDARSALVGRVACGAAARERAGGRGRDVAPERRVEARRLTSASLCRSNASPSPSGGASPREEGGLSPAPPGAMLPLREIGDARRVSGASSRPAAGNHS